MEIKKKMSKEICKKSWITIMFGGAGYFAAHVGIFINADVGEYQDVIQTGIGRYQSRLAATVEARHWAELEGIMLDPHLSPANTTT